MYVADGLLVEVCAPDDGILNRFARIIMYSTLHDSVLRKASR